MADRKAHVPDDLVNAVSGDKRAALEAIRDRLANELLTARGQSAAAVAKELRAVIDELDSLPDGREESTVDQLNARREARRAEAARR